MHKLVSMLAAAAAAVALPAAPASADPWEEAGVYVVPTNVPMFTVWPSEPGASYSIVVSGVATYGDGAGLIDCGFWSSSDGSNLATTWHVAPSGNFFIDNEQQSCGRYNSSHTYAITRVGDGGFWKFEFAEKNGFDGDNAGALVVTVVKNP